MKLLVDDWEAQVVKARKAAGAQLYHTVVTAQRGDWREIDARLAECEALDLAGRLARDLARLTGQAPEETRE